MKVGVFIFGIVCSAVLVTHSAEAKFGFLKRGFKHCTGVCYQPSLCNMTPENDKKFKWCVKNCSHKMDVKGMCEGIFPFNARPILPYEDFSGDLSTNNITPFGLSGLDMTFIKQTEDKRRIAGIAKRLLLVHEQYVKGHNIQRLDQKKRSALANKLLRGFF